jgi:hypothetical protein
MLAFPDFSQPFEIHTDASALQLRAVVAQNNRPIAFFSRKLNSAQTRYTTTEREILAIVETLKEFRTILLGQKIRVYTDHKNLTYANFNTDRVMRWRLILEEYGPELIYIKGTTNIVADALSRLTTTPPDNIVEPNLVMIRDINAHLCGLEKHSSTDGIFPLTFSTLQRAQHADAALLKALQSKSDYALNIFRGGGKTYELIVRDKKIVIPKNIQRRVVEWYHEYLCHPGETRTEQTIRQHYWWNNLRQTVHDICQKCHTCQLTKKSHMKYGTVPEKEAEATPWDVLCIDLIGPYTIERKNKTKKPLTLWALTMIDPATGWFEMREIPTKKADVVANVLEQAWLTRYPWPTQMIFDRGSEFKAEMTQMLKADYGIKIKAVTTRNPQANAIVERIHQRHN